MMLSVRAKPFSFRNVKSLLNLGTRCDDYTYKLITGNERFGSCHSYIREAIKEHNLEESDVHDVWNIFMCTGFTRVTITFNLINWKKIYQRKIHSTGHESILLQTESGRKGRFNRVRSRNEFITSFKCMSSR